jgi:hypothetical protein
VAVGARVGNGARVKLLPRATGRRSSKVEVGELTLIVESQVPSTATDGRRPARPWVTELVDGPGAGWRGDLSEAGVAQLPASLLATRRRDGAVDPIGEYVLERLDGGVAYYRWDPSPT